MQPCKKRRRRARIPSSSQTKLGAVLKELVDCFGYVLQEEMRLAEGKLDLKLEASRKGEIVNSKKKLDYGAEVAFSDSQISDKGG